LNQYDVLQVYSTTLVNQEEWVLVAPDEWVEGRFIGKVTPTSTPPPGVENGRWIEVNLFEQTLAVYEQGKLIYATLVASGLDPFFTKPGLFQIQKKLDSTTMSGAFEADRSDYYYLEDVPWTMYYDHARALHGAYWRTAFGYPQSHGCVNLSPADSHWLFNWAKVDDWVYVWDPSGNTPTDPAYYNDGGA
jgi:lipoprotein-anchoring transpeptidase ErfK/SrfK